MGVEIMRISYIACALALVVCVVADDYEFTGDPDKDGAHEMSQMDGNGNGEVTMDELNSFMKKSYYSSEEDLKDLQNDEGNPATPQDIEKMISNDAKELLEELDTDKNGVLKLEEIVAQYKDVDAADGDMEEDMGEEA